jgi:hypothetical protein
MYSKRRTQPWMFFRAVAWSFRNTSSPEVQNEILHGKIINEIVYCIPALGIWFLLTWDSSSMPITAVNAKQAWITDF